MLKRVVSAFVFCSLFVQHARADEKNEVNSHMAKLHQHLLELAPFVFNSQSYSDDRNKEIISKNLRGFEAATLQMEHKKVFADNLGATVMFDVLARSIADATKNFEEGNRSVSRYMLKASLANCATCHTSGMSKRNFDFLSDDQLFAALPSDVARIELLLTTRQFEKAKQLAESLLGGFPQNNAKPFELTYALDQLAAYYTRVNPSPEKAVDYFSKLAEREDFPSEVKADVNEYLKGFRGVKKNSGSNRGKEFGRAKLAKLRKELNMEKGSSLLTYEPEQMVARMQVLGEIHTVFAANKLRKPQDIAEALHLLGLVNNVLNNDVVTQVDDAYFSVCIETVPHTETAVNCYRSLEDSVTLKSSGSAGVFLDLDQLRMLARYKRLAQPFSQGKAK